MSAYPALARESRPTASGQVQRLRFCQQVTPATILWGDEPF
jgi:hypothetical protein